MQLLVLGGTAWLGRAIAAEALERGHEVVCLARGTSGNVPAGARLIGADRNSDDAYDLVKRQQWDAVIDVARQPGHVRRACALLEPVANHWLFVSSANVYASHRELDQDEKAALLPPLESDVMDSPLQYGAAKVTCELAVTESFGPQRTLLARAGLIGGPGDESGRSGYWPWRFARPSNRAGAVLVPYAPNQPIAVIDVRDLAAWLISSAEAGVYGIFNVSANRMPLAEHLAIARRVAGHSGPLVDVSTDWLVGHDVQNWAGPRSLPLWIDDPDWYGMAATNTDRAVAAGLAPRPLAQTLADTLRWELAHPNSVPHGAGLTDREEGELLDAVRSGT